MHHGGIAPLGKRPHTGDLDLRHLAGLNFGDLGLENGLLTRRQRDLLQFHVPFGVVRDFDHPRDIRILGHVPERGVERLKGNARLCFALDRQGGEFLRWIIALDRHGLGYRLRLKSLRDGQLGGHLAFASRGNDLVVVDDCTAARRPDTQHFER